jgi:hypothetical protein
MQNDEFHGRLISSLYLCRLAKSRFTAAIDEEVKKSAQNELWLLLPVQDTKPG